MLFNQSQLNIVRAGSYITYTSLKEIGNRILESFYGIIVRYNVIHQDMPIVDSIDAYLLTMILDEGIGGHTLGITDANLKTRDNDEFYNSIFGGKNPNNDVAVVSTRKLGPEKITCEEEYDLFISRASKVSLHEVGHNLGLMDHASYRMAPDGCLCPMSRGEFNRFGFRGYVTAIIDGRGHSFCDECASFLSQVYDADRGNVHAEEGGRHQQ